MASNSLRENKIFSRFILTLSASWVQLDTTSFFAASEVLTVDTLVIKQFMPDDLQILRTTERSKIYCKQLILGETHVFSVLRNGSRFGQEIIDDETLKINSILPFWM